MTESGPPLGRGPLTALLGLADQYFGYGRHHEAVTICEGVVALDPGWADAWRALGFALDRAGDVEGTVRALDRWALLAPDDPEVELHRAELSLRRDPEAALHALGRATRKARRSGLTGCLSRIDALRRLALRRLGR